MMAVLSARGVEDRAAEAVSGMVWKLTMVAPDSGQNLETRTRPGGGVEGVVAGGVGSGGWLTGLRMSGEWWSVVL